ncbi:MAG: hypothetical protein IT435_18845 [Phycisphaerales bacterium]|nr:hypothetical protein [Phycisphaerales bacterium]
MLATNEPTTITDARPSRWSLAHRLAFRFVFTYAALALTAYPVSMLPFASNLGIEGNALVDPAISHVGEAITGQPVLADPLGAGGDSLFNYIHVLCCAVLAASITLCWSILDRRRLAYPGLAGVLTMGLRFLLAVTLLNYGFHKVFNVQFAPPDAYRLLQSYGDSSPSGLLWTFMGFSPAYTFFAGLMEVIGGTLLLSRRTAGVGALVLCGVMTNVVMLNFCYDVSVKLFSMHLLAMAIVLAVPDMSRLAAVLVLNRTVSAQPRFSSPRAMRSVSFAVALLAGMYAFFGNAWQHHQMWSSIDFGADSPHAGVYKVDRFTVAGASSESGNEPADADPRWNRVLISGGMIAIQRSDSIIVQYMLLEEAGTAEPTLPSDSWIFRCTRPEPGKLHVRGIESGREISVVLSRSESPMLLTSRGFNWVVEEEWFNR